MQLRGRTDVINLILRAIFRRMCGTEMSGQISAFCVLQLERHNETIEGGRVRQVPSRIVALGVKPLHKRGFSKSVLSLNLGKRRIPKKA